MMGVSATREAVIARLRAFSRLEERASGYAEEQSFLETPAGHIFVTAAIPLGPRRGAAFLSCHSFAWEQFELHPLELAFARRAAGEGFPSLSFQARGYGDSGGAFDHVTPSTHVRDAVAAAEQLRVEGGGVPVVPVGPRFGAVIALATAIQVGAPGVALWDPPERLDRYFRRLLRALRVGEVVDEEGVADEAAGAAIPQLTALKRTLEEGGTIDLFGYPLTSACYREALTMDPLADPAHLPPRVLIVTVNPDNRGSTERLASRLRDLGSDVRVEGAEGSGRAEFGLGLPKGGHLAKHLSTFLDVARRTLDWARDAW